MLLIEKQLIETDDGDFIRYTPVLNDCKDVRFSGRITFAFWECPMYAPASQHDEAKRKALDNARQVLKALAN